LRNVCKNNTQLGIFLEYSDFEFRWKLTTGSNIYENLLQNNQYGLKLKNSHQNRIEHNQIQNNINAGVILEDSTWNTICHNKLQGNDIGIDLYEGEFNWVFINNFTGNRLWTWGLLTNFKFEEWGLGLIAIGLLSCIIPFTNRSDKIKGELLNNIPETRKIITWKHLKRQYIGLKQISPETIEKFGKLVYIKWPQEKEPLVFVRNDCNLDFQNILKDLAKIKQQIYLEHPEIQLTPERKERNLIVKIPKTKSKDTHEHPITIFQDISLQNSETSQIEKPKISFRELFLLAIQEIIENSVSLGWEQFPDVIEEIICYMEDTQTDILPIIVELP
jgi:parallel beta-helix repeat protein